MKLPRHQTQTYLPARVGNLATGLADYITKSVSTNATGFEKRSAKLSLCGVVVVDIRPLNKCGEGDPARATRGKN